MPHHFKQTKRDDHTVVYDAKNETSFDIDASINAGIDADWFAVLMANLDFSYLRLCLPGLVEASDQEIALAYVNASGEMRIDPHAEFSRTHYLQVNDDVKNAGLDPYFHFIHYGEAEGRQPWLSQWGDRSVPAISVNNIDRALTVFDVDFYIGQKPELNGLTARAVVSHYLTVGWRMGLEPFEGFMETIRNAHGGYLDVADEIPLLAWLEARDAESLAETGVLNGTNEAPAEDQVDNDALYRDIEVVRPFFDTQYYRVNNPDLTADDDELITHFMTVGWQEGRNPSPTFSVDFYLESYSDIAENKINPFLHYVLHGKSEGRRAIASEKQTIKFNPTATITPPHLSSVLRYPVEPHQPAMQAGAVDFSCLDLHWIIPDFSRGGGGHMTIFRTIRMLEVLSMRPR